MEDFNSKYTGQQVEDLLDQVASGDIPEEVYIADFTMSSLRQGMNNGEQVRCDMNSLIEAMAANKIILVREDEESYGFKGAYVLNGYAEDLLYFSIVDSIGNVLYCNGTSYTDIYNHIDGSTLYIQRWEDKGTYSKPSGGIPKSDLASDVQGVINNAVTKKNWSGLEYIDTQAVASEDFVYALPDTANGKEDDILLSKKTVKTINGESIMGSGNIVISGGSSSSGGGKEFVEIEPEFEPGVYIGTFSSSNPLEPNKVYVFSRPINSLYVNNINESGSVGDEYTIMFTAGEESPIIAISDYQAYWANGTIPSIASGDMCELSLVRIGNVMKATLGIFKAV